MPVSDQGVNQKCYTLIPRTLIFITRDERVLLLKGASDKRLWANQYNGIGGHMEPGEGVMASAARELYEETGIQDANLWLCGTLIVDTGDTPGVCIFIFRGECTSNELIPSPEGTLSWVAFSKVGELPLVEDLMILLPRILVMKRSEIPFSARSYYNAQGNLTTLFDDDQHPSKS